MRYYRRKNRSGSPILKFRKGITPDSTVFEEVVEEAEVEETEVDSEDDLEGVEVVEEEDIESYSDEEPEEDDEEVEEGLDTEALDLV